MKQAVIYLSAAFFLSGAMFNASSALGKADDGRAGNWKNSAQGAPSLEESASRAQKNPQDADAQNDYGWALRQNGKTQDAEKILREAIKINPSMSQAHSNLSVVLQEENKTREELEEARKAV